MPAAFLQKMGQARFFLVTENGLHPRQGRHLRRGPLSIAAGHPDGGFRILAGQAADRPVAHLLVLVEELTGLEVVRHQGQDLSAGRAWAQIVSVRSVESTRLRIAPGDPDASYLISKVKGDATITGSRMPLGGALPPERVKLLVDWVRRGAPND